MNFRHLVAVSAPSPGVCGLVAAPTTRPDMAAAAEAMAALLREARFGHGPLNCRAGVA